MKTYIITEEELNSIVDMISACGIFKTPLEKRKHWNEFKDDAAKRLNEGAEIIEKIKTELRIRQDI